MGNWPSYRNSTRGRTGHRICHQSQQKVAEELPPLLTPIPVLSCGVVLEDARGGLLPSYLIEKESNLSGCLPDHPFALLLLDLHFEEQFPLTVLSKGGRRKLM